jgi:hypothetical protein
MASTSVICGTEKEKGLEGSSSDDSVSPGALICRQTNR